MFFFLLLSVSYGLETGRSVTIIYTNDILGALEHSKAYWVSLELPPELGNAASLKVLAKKERNKNEVLLLNSGNLAPYNFPDEKKTPGELSQFLNEAGYDASLIGTNELSYGREFIEELIKFSKTRLLSINLEDCNSKKYIILEKDDIRYGIFGITSPYYKHFVPQRFRDEFDVNLNIEEETERIVNELSREDVDVIIGLSDAGYMRDSILAENVNGIDLIVGASNRGWTLREPVETPTNHTLLVKAYSNLSSAGVLKLFFDEENRISGYKHELKTLFLEEFPPYK